MPPQTHFQIIGRGGFGSVFKALWRGQVVAVKVLEHGDEFVGCADSQTGQRKVDTSGRRAALLEGAVTSTINHPNVVQTFDYRVVHLNSTPAPSHGLASNRVLMETHIIMEWCDRGSLQVRRKERKEKTITGGRCRCLLACWGGHIHSVAGEL